MTQGGSLSTPWLCQIAAIDSVCTSGDHWTPVLPGELPTEIYKFNESHTYSFNLQQPVPSSGFSFNMKTTFILGALAALCQSAFALSSGTYTIGSAALSEDQVLTDVGADQPVEFAQKTGHPYETWDFKNTGSQRDFVIQNLSGGYLNCGEELGTTCVSGDNEEVYALEQVTEKGYQLVAKSSGYFVRVVGEELQLAEFDIAPEEEFILTPV